MRPLNLGFEANSPATILCLGAHSDDIEIGCGGTVLRLAKEFPLARFAWVVFSGPGSRRAEAQRAADLFAGGRIVGEPRVEGFKDGFMPFSGAEIKSVFEELKQTVSPDLVFTHNRKDAHQDHRLLAELTWNTFRDHVILEYEIPKYDGDLGQPSAFVTLDADICEKKIQNIMTAFQSQHGKHWFQPELFRSLMRLRGMECNSPSGYAEAFYCRKLAF
jgi:LmbE family N-acetylglucosaminyl deacetylase